MGNRIPRVYYSAGTSFVVCEACQPNLVGIIVDLVEEKLRGPIHKTCVGCEVAL